MKSITVNLPYFANYKKWLLYMPGCFISNLNKKEYYYFLLQNRKILHSIEQLITFINQNTNKKIVYDTNIIIDNLNIDKYNELKKLIKSIPIFDIRKYAKYKLSKKELEEIDKIVNSSTNKKEKDILKEIENNSNPFFKEYAKFMVFNNPNSTILYTRKMIK